MKRLEQSGFTVPELLVTCGVFIVLAITSSFFLHPRDYSRINRNAERHIALARLMLAIRTYTEDHGGLPPSIEARQRLIGSQNNSQLCHELVPRYLKSIPSDPLLQQADVDDCSADYDTALAVNRSADGKHVTVTAPLAEGGARISITY